MLTSLSWGAFGVDRPGSYGGYSITPNAQIFINNCGIKRTRLGRKVNGEGVISLSAHQWLFFFFFFHLKLRGRDGDCDQKKKKKKKKRVIILPTSPATLFPPLAAITEGYLCLKHVTKWERGTGESWGARALLSAAGAPTYTFVWLLRRCAPLSVQRCGVGGSSRREREREKKGGEKKRVEFQNGIFNHLRGAAVRVPVAAFRRICPTLDPAAALWLTQMRKRVFF